MVMPMLDGRAHPTDPCLEEGAAAAGVILLDPALPQLTAHSTQHTTHTTEHTAPHQHHPGGNPELAEAHSPSCLLPAWPRAQHTQVSMEEYLSRAHPRA